MVSSSESGDAPVTDAMNELEISHQEVSRLANEATQLATSYWETLADRRSYPSTSGKQTTFVSYYPTPVLVAILYCGRASSIIGPGQRMWT